MKLKHLLILLLLSFCYTPKESNNSDETPELKDFPNPSKNNSSLPYLITGKDGNLYMSWVEKRDSIWVDFNYSFLKNDEWTEPEIIASGSDWFVNWADYPMLAVDKEGNKIAHYLAKSSSGTYSYDVNVVIKPKDSSNWSTPVIPHADGTPTEHGFVTMIPNNDDTFLLAWLDGRNTESNHGHDHAGAMTLRSAVMDLKGELSEQTELDARVCDCCHTTGTQTPEGVILAYRDRSLDEIRDIGFIHKKNSAWSKPQFVSSDAWEIKGCPVNGPRISSFNNSVAIAWYTEALSKPTVKVAFKTDSSFSNPIIIDQTSPVGRVDIEMISDEKTIVSWIDGGDDPAIKYRVVNKNGTMSSTKTVSTISAARGSGFPQIEVFNNALYIAWTDFENQKIRMKRISLD